MHSALNDILASLPDDTYIYPGHEYTLNNTKFALSVSQAAPVQELKKYSENNRETQGVFTMAQEKKHNVFMQVESDEMRKVTGESDPVGVMGKLRQMKDSF